MRELVSKGEIMKKRRSVLALLLVAALTVVLGGCQDGKDGKADSSDTTSSQVSTESTPTGEPVMGGSITVGIPQDIEDSLDPHKSVAAGTKEILFNIYEGLVKPDEEGNLNDAVAERAIRSRRMERFIPSSSGMVSSSTMERPSLQRM